MKRNKIRYKAEVKVEKRLTLTGVTTLMYHDDDAAAYNKGDMMLHPQNEALHTTRQGDYDSTGFAGYFKIDVWDGREWQPVILNEIFTDKINHFSKTECPIDTYGLCAEYLQGFAGRQLRRIYREHYELVEDDEA